MPAAANSASQSSGAGLSGVTEPRTYRVSSCSPSTARCCSRGSWTTRKSSSNIRARPSSKSAARATRPSSWPPASSLKPGHDWFYPYYRDRALCLQLGMTPLDMLLAAVGAEDDPSSHGRQMPSHWGRPDLNIVSQSSATTHAGAAGGRRRRSRASFTVVSPTIPDRESRFKSDEVVYVSLGEGATSGGEFWEGDQRGVPPAPARAVSHRGQRLRDFGSRGIPDRRRRHLAARPLVSGTACRIDRRHRFLRSLRAMRDATAYVRARKGPALVHARVIRPYSHSLSDDEKLYKTPAEREAEARRDPIARFSGVSALARPGDRRGSRRDRRRHRSRAERGSQRRARGAEALEGHRRAAGSIRRMSIRRRPRSTRRPGPKGKPDTMVGAINRTLKDEMAHDPRIVVFGEDVADASRREILKVVSGKGGVFKVTHGLQTLYGDDRVFNTSLAEAAIIGRGVGMATRRLKPVVEIQFFDYIWPAMMQIRDEMSMLRYRSGNTFSCPMVDPRADRRLPARRRPVSQPVRREHLRALSRNPDRVSVDRRRCRRPAAHLDPLRRSGDVSGTQASVPADLQQGRVSRQRLHDPVRESRAPPGGHRRRRSSRGARSFSARCLRPIRRKRTASAWPSSICGRSSPTTGRPSPHTSSARTG